MSDDKLQSAIGKGAQAEALLRHELLTGAFAGLEADYIKAWRVTPARDTDARERLWQAVQVVGLVHNHLSRIVNDGKLAQRELNDLAGKARRWDKGL
jgi:hypothetical protein